MQRRMPINNCSRSQLETREPDSDGLNPFEPQMSCVSRCDWPSLGTILLKSCPKMGPIVSIELWVKTLDQSRQHQHLVLKLAARKRKPNPGEWTFMLRRQRFHAFHDARGQARTLHLSTSARGGRAKFERRANIPGERESEVKPRMPRNLQQQKKENGTENWRGKTPQTHGHISNRIVCVCVCER